MKSYQLLMTIATAVIIMSITTATSSFADHDETKDGSPNSVAPPTLGINNDGEIVVQSGFSINGNSYEVEKAWQNVPTHTFNVGEPIQIKLKVYEEMGAQNLDHVVLYPNMVH